jgi:hypothetical protein
MFEKAIYHSYGLWAVVILLTLTLNNHNDMVILSPTTLARLLFTSQLEEHQTTGALIKF